MVTEITQAMLTSANFISYINRAVENAAEGDILSVEKGIYHLYEQDTSQQEYYLSNSDVIKTRSIAILIKNKSKLTIDFNGSTLLCHGQLQPLTVDGAQNVEIKNLVIDWEIPLSAEGISVAIGKGYTDFAINQNLFPHHVKDNQLFFSGENWVEPLWSGGHAYFDAVTGLAPVGSGDVFSATSAQLLENGNIRLFAEHNVPVGCIAVLRHSRRIHAAIFTVDSKNISYEAITVHASGGLGMLSQFNENLFFKKVRFQPNRAAGRHALSGHDDGIHLVNNKGTVTVEGCSFYGLMDDPINIHGIAVRVVEIINKTTLVCRFMHGQSMGFYQWAKADELIGFIENESMATYHKAEVIGFKLNSPVEFTIEFKSELPDSLKLNDALENVTNIANFICKNNYFGSCRARGILISTGGDVLVENNVFETSGSAILVAGDSNQWFESGACHKIDIRNNVFTSACLSAMYQFCEGIISICPEIPKPQTNKPFHENITIENNVFNPFDFPVLYAFSTNNLKFIGNIIRRSNQNQAWHERKHMINLNLCKNITIDDNQLIGNVLGKDVHYIETNIVELL